MTMLNNLARLINHNSSSHGFWPNDKQDVQETLVLLSGVVPDQHMPELQRVADYVAAQEVRNMGEMLMLAVSELAEALEEHRDGKPVFYTDHGDYTTERGEASYTVERGKPEGIAVELADCIIRCLDTMYSLDVDIDAVVHAKMMYNESRPHKHGKAY